MSFLWPNLTRAQHPREGCAFTAANELVPARVESLVGGYLGRRGLSQLELRGLKDFVWAAVMAVGAWRFLNFHLAKPESPQGAKDSYKVMWRRIEVLESTREWPSSYLSNAV